MRRPGAWPASDLVLTAVLTLVLAPLALLTSGTPRTALGVVFVLFLVGYSLVCALFPRKSSLGVVERLALSLGLSFAVVAILGLGLNYTPLGIRFYPILILLTGFVLVMCAIAWYRRRGLALEERFSPQLVPGILSLAGRWSGQRTSGRVLTVMVALAAAVAVGTAGYVAARPNPGDRFTEFYILDRGGGTLDYPRELVPEEIGVVIAGIVNREYNAVTYRISVTVGGETVRNVGPVVLLHEEKRELTVDWTPPRSGDKQEVDFLLYKGTETQPYRSLRLWINVRKTP